MITTVETNTEAPARPTPGQILYRCFMMRPEYRELADQHFLNETDKEKREWEQLAIRYAQETAALFPERAMAGRLEDALRDMVGAFTACQRTRAGERGAALLLELEEARKATAAEDQAVS